MARQKSAHVYSEHDATMTATVRRFTGRYECGCQVDKNVLQPSECKTHGQPAVYEFQELEVTNIEIGPGLYELLEEV